MATCPSPRRAAPAHLRVAYRLLDDMRGRAPIDRARLRALFERETGASDATGAWSMRAAYDALELAQAFYLRVPDCPLLAGDARAVLEQLDAFGARLPVQSYRSEAQVALQQFSTPLPLAFIAARAAGARAEDILLEPSAGNGLLAAIPARAGCRLILNELDPDRSAGLADAFAGAALSGHDAELIDDLLDPRLRPSLVLMNPPFARSVGRDRDRFAAARHLAAAMARLAPGGRLVAIMPDSFADHGSGRALKARVGRAASLRLEADVAAGVFSRHGTGVGVRLMVYDKLQDGAGEAPALRAETLADLLDAVETLKMRGRAGERPSRAPARPAALFAAHAARRPPVPARPCAPLDVRAEPLPYRVLADPAPAAEAAGLYLPYRPTRIAIEGAAPHPTPLVESLAMGSIAAPMPDHVPQLPARLVAEGHLSEAQLETLVYAGSAFARDLPGRFVPVEQGTALAPNEEGTAYRCGYFLGDGTGAGKGRQVAGVILDQWLRGNRRHIWISKTETLLEDARRDWAALGGLPLDIQPLSQWTLGTPLALETGILFVTYPTLRSGRADATRLDQLLAWAGAEFEGVIAFDEAHAMANAAGGEGRRGRIKGSEQGLCGLRLQNNLPRARILYASATGASDVSNLAYATRLGLWGPETAFADRAAFADAIREGGMAAMELVARDLKALGLYGARAVSFAGVEYDILEHALSADQVEVYDSYADAWAIIHTHLEAALESSRIVDSATGETLNANARSAALSKFEGTKQRFFGQLLLAMKLPSLLPAIERDLGGGQAVVVQLVSTAEAMLDRRLADLSAEEREALEIDLSPREHVIDYLASAFPTRQMRVFTDADGNRRSEPLSDEEGRPVHCRAALHARDALIERLCALPPIPAALDAIIERFGTQAVAEVTGRSRRLVCGSDGRQRLERRASGSNLRETDAFMRGDKRILVFSDAGGTGRSYHACLKAANQARRVHYLLEPGWRADAAIQGLGRTHRTHQASAPLFRPVTTDVRGERRFISTIARRLDALGALTRGQRQTGGQNLFDPADNLESDYARDALTGWYRLLHAGKLRSVGFARFQELTGLALEGEDGALRETLPPIQRWLNRLLALRIALQNAIFDEFLGLVEARIAAAREAGRLDLGLEAVPVEDFTILDDRVIRTDSRSGATTHLLRVEIARRLRPLGVEKLRALRANRPDAVPMRNRRSRRAALCLDARHLISEEGAPIARCELVRPLKRDYWSREALAESHWESVSERAFEAAWTSEADEALKKPRREILHLATGLLLPVWDVLPGDWVQVARISADDGRSLLGRLIPEHLLSALGAKLGLDVDLQLAPDRLAEMVMRSGQPMAFRAHEALVLKRALVNGSQRLELTGFSASRLGWYKATGCFTEIIRYQTRLFVPVDRAGAVLSGLAGANAGPPAS